MGDDVRWFDRLGTCRCGKPATGKLMDSRNASHGPYCEKCATKRIKTAQHTRELAERATRKFLQKKPTGGDS